MSFYGNIKNTARTQFYFDRIYGSRSEMESACKNGDGIFAGRFVLVEYEQGISNDTFPRFYYYGGQMYTEMVTLEVTKARKVTVEEGSQEPDPNKVIAFTGPVMESLITTNHVKDGDICCVPIGWHIQYATNGAELTYRRIDTSDGVLSKDFYNGKDYKEFYEKNEWAEDPNYFEINGQICTEKPFLGGQLVKVYAKQLYTTSEKVQYFRAHVVEDGIEWKLVADSESHFVRNWNIDNNKYEGRTFDSTVWQKVYIGNQEQYIMIADLNAIAPRFTFTADAPTVTPIPIHYDPVNTNTNYNIHMQTPWGLRIRSANGNLRTPKIDHKGQIAHDEAAKVPVTEHAYQIFPSDFPTEWKGHFYDIMTQDGSEKYYSPISEKWNGVKGNWSSMVDGAIYINRPGFNPRFISKSSDLMDPQRYGYRKEVNVGDIGDMILLEPTGYSGRVYNDHLNNEGLMAQPDTQELTIMLPSLGNSISDIWDIIYGGRETNNAIKSTDMRNMDIYWEYANGVLKRSGLRAVSDSQGRFKAEEVNTLAGCINSIHDLMGQIIVNDCDDTMDISTLEEGYIYLFKDGTYRRKTVEYTYDKTDYFYTPIVLSDTTYAKGEYYYKSGEDYLVCNDNAFDPSKSYFYKTVVIPDKFTPISLTARPAEDMFYRMPSGVDGKYDYRIVPEVTEDVDYYTFSSANVVKVTAFYEPYAFYYYDGDKNAYVLDTAEKGTKDRAYWKFLKEELQTCLLKERQRYNLETHKYMTDEVDPETNMNIEKDLKYIYCPGVFYHYKEEIRKDENGETILDKDGNPEIAKTVRLENRTYDEIALDKSVNIDEDYRIIWAKPVEGGAGDWVMNPDGSYTTSSGVTNLDVDQMFKVKFIPFIENEYFYKGQRTNTKPELENPDIKFDDEEVEAPEEGDVPEVDEPVVEDNPFIETFVLEYHVLTEEKLKELYANEFTGQETTAVHTDFYKISFESAGTFYAPDCFYYRTEDGSYAIDRNEEMTKERIYYDVVNFIYKRGMKFYIPNKYYIIDPVTGNYILDKTKEFDSSKTYYKFNGCLYVMSDSMNKFAPHSEWNENITQVPASVELGLRTEHDTTKVLDHFARQLNTIHGLILQVNKMLEIDNFDTRDRNTVQGCINTVNDIINKFEILKPNDFLIVDDYGRVHNAHWDTLQKTSSTLTKAASANEKDLAEGIIQDQFREVDSVANMRGQWLTLYMNSSPANPEFRIHHNFQKVTDTTSTSNKNTDNVASGKDSDKLTLYTPIVDAMGHVVGKNTETVTLPYGFKTIASGADSTAVTELTTSHPNVVAENTQDTFTINTGNKWIRTATNANNDSITFAHALSPISANANTKYGLVADETINLLDGDNTFEVPVFQFDEAGHIIFAETHTVTIPEVFENITIVGGSTNTDDTISTDGTITADKLQDTLNFAAGNRWLQMSHDATTDTITFKHYVKKFTETTDSTDLDNSNTFTVQEVSWDNAGHLTGSVKRTYTLQDGYKQVGVANSGSNTTTSPTAAAGTLTAATQVDKFTIDTGNRWITLVANESGKTVTIAHATAGTATNSKGDTTAQTPNFGATFKVLSAGIDQTGHVKDLAEHTVKIPLPSLADDTTGNVVTGLTLEAATGAFALTKENVGTLTLAGYSAPTGRTTGTIANTSTINGAFATIQSYLYSLTDRIDNLDLTDSAVDGEFVNVVNQTNGKIEVSRTAFVPSVTIGAGTASAAPTVNISVNGKSATAQSITTATTGVYGVTKLSDAVNSTSTTLAATANAVKKAYDLANGAIAKTATFTYQPTGGTQESLTVEQLVAKVAALEARIKTLEDEATQQ